MSERGPRGHGPEGQPGREQEGAPYVRVARFASEETALRVYQQAQDAILRTPCDVSVYRFLLDQVSHVAALGLPPPRGLARRLERLMSAGEPATLPPDILDALFERRRQATQLGPWVEGHYRPGERLNPEPMEGGETNR